MPPQPWSSYYFPGVRRDEYDEVDHDPQDDDFGDLDSAYGDDSFIGDDTKTLSCYITDYRFEYGRRYHSYRDGAYWVCVRSIVECDVMHHLILIDLFQGPNDETANEQQDVAHHMYYLTLDGRLHLAPLNNPQVWVLRLIAR